MRRTGTRKMITDAQMITEAKRVTTGKTSACTRTGSIMHMVFDTTIGHWQIIGVDRRNPKHYDGNRQPQNPRPRDENPVNSWREPPNKYRRDDQCKLHNMRQYQYQPQPQDENKRPLVPVTPLVVKQGELSLLCFTCQQPGHYATQCPHKDKGKRPAINTILIEVQQVTTCGKVKALD